MNVDTSGITALVELHNNLIQIGIELVIVNPKWHVFHKLNQAKFVSKIGGRVYLTIREALDACFGLKFYGRLKLVIPGPQGRRQVNMFCLLLQKLNITFRQGSARL
ncbi:hypothetical protein YC2023_120293 [Brassica napus]